MTEQPEALRLAEYLDGCVWYNNSIAAELRRQHAEIERLREYADTLVRERNAAWAESAELRKDAGRYRWLSGAVQFTPDAMRLSGAHFTIWFPATDATSLSDAIDAAMKEPK